MVLRAIYGSGFLRKLFWMENNPYHEPMRLFVIIEAPLERISMIIHRHDLLQHLTAIIGSIWSRLIQ